MSDFISITPTTYEPRERAEQRTLSQFWKSTVFNLLLQALIEEVAVLQEELWNTIIKRGPADATGEPQNVLGRIVGQSRNLSDYILKTDVVEDAPDQEATDEWYTDLIQARVQRNFSLFGSVPEIKIVAQTSLGIEVSYYRAGMMIVDIIVNWDTTRWQLDFLRKFLNVDVIESQPFLPYPATLSIRDTYWMDSIDLPFTPDRDDGYQVDVAFASVKN